MKNTSHKNSWAGCVVTALLCASAAQACGCDTEPAASLSNGETVGSGGTGGSVPDGGTGGSVPDSGTGGSVPDGGPGDGCGELAGFYNLALYPGHSPKPEADATPLALKLASDGTDCVATVTPSFYPSVSIVASVGEQEVTLDDSTGPNVLSVTVGWYQGMQFFNEYHFRTITLPRSADGKLTGEARAVVELFWAQDDVCAVDDVKYSGTIAADTTAPVLRAGPQQIRIPTRPGDGCGYPTPTGGKARPGLPESLLPWDNVEVQASEPLAGLAAHLKMVDAANPGGTPVVFADAEVAKGVVATDTWAWATFPDWEAARGTTQTIRVTPALADAVGNAVSKTSFSLTVLDVGAAQPSHEFEGDTLALASFGDVSQAAGAVTIKAPCGSGTGGIAGRLATTGATKVFAHIQPGNMSGMQFRLWGKSGTRYRSDEWVQPGSDGWATLEVQIATEDEVGFTLSPNSLCHWTSGASVVVDRIWAE